MTSEVNFFHQFLTSNVIRSMHNTTISILKITLLYRLAIGYDLNFGQIIFNTIRDAVMFTRSRTKLIMPSLISALCKRVRVPMLPSKAGC